MSFDFFFWRRWEIIRNVPVERRSIDFSACAVLLEFLGCHGERECYSRTPHSPLPMLYSLHSCDGSHRYLYNCTLNIHILQCLACDGCRHYVTDVRHFPTDGWTPPTRQISQKRFHKSERKLHKSVICHTSQSGPGKSFKEKIITKSWERYILWRWI